MKVMDMPAAIGFEEFKRQADIIHHNRFQYDPSSYTNTRGVLNFLILLLMTIMNKELLII